MYIYLWCFFILAFTGWLGEVAYAALVEKKFVNRGFLNGPLCPIYGIGAISMYLLLQTFADNTMLLLLTSMLVGSVIEWVAGFLLEKIFHQKWWDYSDSPYNLHGYICLGFSTVWGLAGVVCVRYLMPFLLGLVNWIPQPLGWILLSFFLVLLILDLVLTVISISGLQKKLNKLEVLSNNIRMGSDFIGKALSDTVQTAKEKYDELELKEKYNNLSDKTKQELTELKEKYQEILQNLKQNKIQLRLIRAFPKATSSRYDEQLRHIREVFDIISKKSSNFLEKRNNLARQAYENNLPEGTEKPFAYGISFCKLFWVFMIGNVIGFIVETLWCVLPPPHNFELRVSVIYGPFVLVYGFGAVILTLLLHRFHDKKDFYLFLISMIIGASFEYLCSYFQELVFGSVSWDYSHSMFNLGGRTNLMYSFFWGVLGMVWIKDLYPRLSLFIEKMPKKPGNIITIIVVIFMSLNILLSAAAVYRQGQRLKNIPATSKISLFLDRHYDDEFLATRYINMKFLHDQ